MYVLNGMRSWDCFHFAFSMNVQSLSFIRIHFEMKILLGSELHNKLKQGTKMNEKRYQVFCCLPK